MTATTQHAMEAAAQRQAASDAALQQHVSNIANFIAGLPIAAAAANGAAPNGTGAATSSGSKKRRRQDAAAPAAEAPAAPVSTQQPAAAAGVGACALGLASCAVLLGGPLAWLLRLLFSNDSLMDVGGRQQLYREAMRLLRCVSCCQRQNAVVKQHCCVVQYIVQWNGLAVTLVSNRCFSA
jgi:hypothetical protein